MTKLIQLRSKILRLSGINEKRAVFSVIRSPHSQRSSLQRTYSFRKSVAGDPGRGKACSSFMIEFLIRILVASFRKFFWKVAKNSIEAKKSENRERNIRYPRSRHLYATILNPGFGMGMDFYCERFVGVQRPLHLPCSFFNSQLLFNLEPAFLRAVNQNLQILL